MDKQISEIADDDYERDFYNSLSVFFTKIVQKEEESDWCYLLYDPDSNLYKLGITINPYKRLSAIRHASGRMNLKLVFAIQMQVGVDEAAWMVEKGTKKFFKSCRVVGEWYRFTPRHLVILRGLVNYLGGEDTIDNQRDFLKNRSQRPR